MDNTKNRSVSDTSHHVYHISTLVSMITGSTKLIDMGTGGRVDCVELALQHVQKYALSLGHPYTSID